MGQFRKVYLLYDLVTCYKMGHAGTQAAYDTSKTKQFPGLAFLVLEIPQHNVRPSMADFVRSNWFIHNASLQIGQISS